jgi:hypothetical protein
MDLIHIPSNFSVYLVISLSIVGHNKLYSAVIERRSSAHNYKIWKFPLSLLYEYSTMKVNYYSLVP